MRASRISSSCPPGPPPTIAPVTVGVPAPSISSHMTRPLLLPNGWMIQRPLNASSLATATLAQQKSRSRSRRLIWLTPMIAPSGKSGQRTLARRRLGQARHESCSAGFFRISGDWRQREPNGNAGPSDPVPGLGRANVSTVAGGNHARTPWNLAAPSHARASSTVGTLILPKLPAPARRARSSSSGTAPHGPRCEGRNRIQAPVRRLPFRGWKRRSA